jgi:IPT/TIG domain
MVRRVLLAVALVVAGLSGLIATGAPASASLTTELVLPQGSAFAVLGHSCGGIQEKAFATGFDGTSGFPTGDVYMQTRCGGSGRGGGYHTTTYSAWAEVTWDFTDTVVSYSVLGIAPSVDPTFSLFDSHGNEVYNSSNLAFLTLATGFVPVPRVTALSLTVGPALGGSSVTITGTGFTGATSVDFGGAPAAQFSVSSSTSISATTPTTGAGTVGVTVTNGGQTNLPDANDQFTFVAAPVVSGVNPNSGPISGGTSVMITGSGFTDAQSVSFGGNLAAFTVNGDSSITATSPGIDGPDVQDVQVTTAGGPSAISSVDQFSYVSGGCSSCSTLWFTSAPFASASVGTPFSFSVITSGGTGTKVSKTGALPKGVKLVSNADGTATISGTPVSTLTRSAAGIWTLTIKAKSGRGAARQVVTQTFELTVN